MSDANTLGASTTCVAGLVFTGPMDSRGTMPCRPGILAVLDVSEDGTCEPIDAFFTKSLRSDVARPMKLDYWLDVGRGRIEYAYLDASGWSSVLVSRMLHHIKTVLPRDWWEEHWSNPAAGSPESAMTGSRAGQLERDNYHD